ncbi:MAG TPA: NAD(P)-dependent oxidoreductase [Xanthobacteraceae bacterium]|nr:NAD(P)-dependent oxidoreductase [Xanthobacteraceae bacterium]
MLRHHHPRPLAPDRVVLLGAGGFIGKAVAAQLAVEHVPVMTLGRNRIDLTARDADERLAGWLQRTDALVMVSARAPCKTPQMLLDNIQMMGAVCAALGRSPVAHVVYVSSDAVYHDALTPLSEDSPAAPASLHGAMHVAREQMLKAALDRIPLAVLRPTLVYGAADPHNGYGPNRFRRLANRGEPIVLFGEGEERRDHVAVEDVAAIAGRVLAQRSEGTLNVATGVITSFRAIAEQVVALSPRKVAISAAPRSGPLPHNGYRAFDPQNTLAAFPDFRYTTLAEGLARAQQQEFGS